MDEKDLNINGIDITTSTIKAALGVVPLAGTFLGELVTVFIPNQRMDRVVDFLKKLAIKFKDIENKCKENSAAIFLIEEGIRISAKTTNEMKREWIASIVGKGIYDEIEPNITEKFISILDEITYEQVIVLLYFRTKENHELYSTRSQLESIYSEIVMPPAFHIRDLEKRSLCENNFNFNTSFLQSNALLKKTLSFNSSYHYSFPSDYKSDTIKSIIEDYRKDIYEAMEKSINETEWRITSLGTQFIDNIINDIDIVEIKH